MAEKELLRYKHWKLFDNNMVVTASARKDRIGVVTVALEHNPPNMFVESTRSRQVCEATWTEIKNTLHESFGDRLFLNPPP